MAPDSYAMSLLHCAVDACQQPESPTDLRSIGPSDWPAARDKMVSAHRYTSSVEMRTALATEPKNPYHHCVDLVDGEPGIVVSTRPSPKIARLVAPSEGGGGGEGDGAGTNDRAGEGSEEPRRAYSMADALEEEAHVLPDATPRRTATAAAKRADRLACSAQKRMVKRAVREETADAKRLVTDEAKRARKQLLATETKEERDERRARERSERERKAAERAEAKATKPPTERTTSSRSSAKDASSSEAARRAVVAEDPERDSSEVLPTRLPTRAVRRRESVRFFPNPALHLRMLRATAKAALPPDLAAAFLGGAPHPDLSLVVGPPGTGKTTWIVDAVATHLAGHARVLLCAPSNVTAAGLYCRLVAHGDPSLGAQASLCLAADRVPPNTPVQSDDPTARVVCCTIAGRNSPALVAQSFDCVVVDEAAQCSEPLLWTLFREDVRRLVLVGDPAQLRSQAVDEDAERCGHSRSAMERLLMREYEHVAKLTVQRRMHPAICAFPNEMFYDGALRDGDECASHACDGLPPLAFVRTPDDAAVVPIGTSFCNPVEARVVASVVARVVRRDGGADGGGTVDARRVVVVVPYVAHSRSVMTALVAALGEKDAAKVAVHTVDSFQGREADVVVLSVCRRGDRCGFWDNEARLNVACTRARNCMCVVGSLDWRSSPLRELADHLLAKAEDRSEWAR